VCRGHGAAPSVRAFSPLLQCAPSVLALSARSKCSPSVRACTLSAILRLLHRLRLHCAPSPSSSPCRPTTSDPPHSVAAPRCGGGPTHYIGPAALRACAFFIPFALSARLRLLHRLRLQCSPAPSSSPSPFLRAFSARLHRQCAPAPSVQSCAFFIACSVSARLHCSPSVRTCAFSAILRLLHRFRLQCAPSRSSSPSPSLRAFIARRQCAPAPSVLSSAPSSSPSPPVRAFALVIDVPHRPPAPLHRTRRTPSPHRVPRCGGGPTHPADDIRLGEDTEKTRAACSVSSVSDCRGVCSVLDCRGVCSVLDCRGVCSVLDCRGADTHAGPATARRRAGRRGRRRGVCE
jgi:hypothetical protein